MKRITMNGMLATLGLLLAFSGGLCAGTVSYEYDALHRLTQVSYPDGTGIAYSYDPAGNRTQKIVTAFSETDIDGDGVPDAMDNCPAVPNASQEDLDGDGLGDACDPDIDGDGTENAADAFPFDGTEWLDTDADGIGNNADPDDDNDLVLDEDDVDPLDSTVGGVLLSVAKTDTPDPVRAGSKLTYTIDYANDGSSKQSATNVELTESYDPNVTFDTASPMPSPGDNVWNLGDLAPGASGIITVTVDVSADVDDGAQLQNKVTLTSDQAEATATQATLVEREPVLSLTKTDTEPVSAGAEFVYTLTYSNAAAGSATATDVVLTELYDPNTTFVSASPPPDAGTDDVWTLGNLVPGASGQITITMQAASPLANGTQLANVAELSSAEGATASAEETTTVQSAPILGLSQLADLETVAPGETLTLEVTYRNESSANAVATNVVLRETFDPNVIYLSAEPEPDAGTTNQWTLPDLRPGASGTVRIQVQVADALADGTQLSNMAVIESDQGSASAVTVSVVEDTPAAAMFYLTLGGNGVLRGLGPNGTDLAYRDEDILSWNGLNYAMVFDGSTVGLNQSAKISAFDIDATNNRILMSFALGQTVPGVGAVTGSDIVSFDLSSKVFSLLFDGSDVGLGGGLENLDSINLLPDGRLIVSTLGIASVPSGKILPLLARSGDLLAFTPKSLGATTKGTWAMYFDGSAVGLTTIGEGVDAASIARNGDIYLSTLADFAVTGVSGQNEDIFVCTPSYQANKTSCRFWPFFDGTAHGLAQENLKGIDLP